MLSGSNESGYIGGFEVSLKMRFLPVLGLLLCTSVAFAIDPKETMCVKQKDGTYRCKASGKVEKEPCCETPTNPPPKRTPKPKR